jgi:predicted Rossmann fold flavoprotein
MAALAAACEGASVVIVEKGKRIGTKILATGNGRCNLSNLAISQSGGADHYNHPEFVAPALTRYDCEALCSLFGEWGLLTTPDEQGWVFPRTRSAHSVLDVLRNQIRRRRIDVRVESAIEDIAQADDGLFLATAGDTNFSSRAVVLTCGVVPLLESLKPHRLVAPTPILGPLKTEQAPLKGLDGIRVRASVCLWDEDEPVAGEIGEVLLRSYGISGIVAFNLSRFAKPGQGLTLDFFPDFTRPSLESLLLERRKLHSGVSAAEFFDGLLHTRLAQAVLRSIGVDPSDPSETVAVDELAGVLKGYRLRVIGGPARERAQVTRGGFAIEDFDHKTMQSLVWPRLFAAGECLDVDGPCGGFNLHWAGASGLIAGQKAGESVRFARALR